VSPRRSRSKTGDADVDQLIGELLDAAGTTADRDQLTEILVTVARLAGDRASRLDLKITNAAIREMREAFKVFAPYRDVPKVTMFGSARTLPDDPLYAQARDLAAELASQGWMVVTGAGPGIMAAGIEGAGPAKSLGVNIRLPFEQEAAELIAGDPKLVSMKYFFTRKLMLIKESAGFIALPGGFGTLDEIFELLTLEQTGKADPVPLVLLEVPGGTYWKAWKDFIVNEVAARGLVSHDDASLYRVTDDVGDAAEAILGFYRNYHSRRFVGEVMVLRLKAPPTDDELRTLNDEFGDILTGGRIERTQPLAAERATDDHLDLPRIALHFDQLHHGRLHDLIRALNRLASAPPESSPPEPPDKLQPNGSPASSL
jgi:uncharacterized protein (TIGR00730 family)